MLALLLISIAGFFALYFAMLTLLRHAAASGRATASQLERRSGAPNSPSQRPAHTSGPAATLPAKRPDWRFLVRDGRRPFPSGRPNTQALEAQPLTPARKPPTPTTSGAPRSDWAHYNKDLGDLNDPYQATPTTARRA